MAARIRPVNDRAGSKERHTVSLPSLLRGGAFARLAKLLVVALIIATMLTPLAGTPRSARAAGAYTTDYLNLRAGPSAENYIKLVMPPGSYVDLLSDLGRSGYYKVAYAGELGYAHSDYPQRWVGNMGHLQSGTGNR